MDGDGRQFLGSAQAISPEMVHMNPQLFELYYQDNIDNRAPEALQNKILNFRITREYWLFVLPSYQRFS